MRCKPVHAPIEAMHVPTQPSSMCMHRARLPMHQQMRHLLHEETHQVLDRASLSKP